MTIRTFTTDELEALGLPYENYLAKWVSGESRWWIDKEVVFAHDGDYWCVEYSEPATEMQEGQDIWNDATEVVAVKVREIDVTVKRWVPA